MAANAAPGDICTVDLVTSRVLVPAEALGEAMQIVDRLEQELRATEQRLRDAEIALKLERNRRRPWWARWQKQAVENRR